MVHARLFGNSVSDWALAVGIALGLFALIVAIVLAVRHKFGPILRTRLWLLVLPVVYAGARVLTLTHSTKDALKTAAIISLIVQGAIWSVAIVDFFVDRYHRRTESDPSSVTTIRAFRFASVLALWCVAFLLVLSNLGIEVTPLVTTLGIGGVAVALAVQSVLGDLFASLSIVLDKPFLVGDAIGVSEDVGIVERIGLKTTRLRSLSGEQLVYANSELLKIKIHNYKRMQRRRVVFHVGVVYQTSADTLARIPSLVRKAVEDATPTTFDRCHFMNFGDSAYEFETVFYVESPDYNVYMDANQAVYLGVVRAFEAEQIDFAYPTRTLFVSGDEFNGERLPASQPAGRETDQSRYSRG
ncbi:MAG TPA: mechanosensitive ion channel family protein [Thermoanaerobaculia bacterium]|nr:mechanosensitive ion channel family protein [Thermoanaerobaculia bacterium]